MYYRMKFIITIAYIFFASTASAAITSLSIKDKSGSNQTNVPVTFGHLFKQGDVPSGKKIVLAGAQMATQQYDLKTTYSDGSARFAVISAVIPVISAGQTLNYTLDIADATATSGEMTKQQILDTSIAAVINLTNLSDSGYSGSASADLRTAITATSNLIYWLKGATCTEILVDQRLNNNLNATWEVRFYPGTPYIRLSHVLENVEDIYRGNVGYDVDVRQGIGTPSSVYTASSVTHYSSARWRKVFWVSPAPPEVEVKYDMNYVILTGHIPNYDTSLSVPANTLASAYSGWQSSPNELMGNNSGPSTSGVVVKYWPTTGGRSDIGPLPAWTARYLLSLDNRMKQIMLDAAEKVAAAGFHWRESDSSKASYGRPVTLDDRPTLQASEWYITNYPQYRSGLPVAIGTTTSNWTIDHAHQASFAFIPYTVTGEYFYLQEMNYLASWSLVGAPPDSRNNASGWLTTSGVQLRGAAWAARNISQAAALAVDGTSEKAYFSTKLQNIINNWVSDADDFPLGNMSADTYATKDNMTPEVKYVTSPWMEDYLEVVLGYMNRLGFDTNAVRVHHKNFTIGRISGSGFNVYDGIAYRFPAITQDNLPVQSWSSAFSLINGHSASYQNTDATYKQIALAALASVADYSGGIEAYNWLKIQPYVYDANAAAADPTWAILPSGALPPDTTPPTTTASPASGTYTGTQSVTLSCTDTSGCEGVYFTTNGDTPVYPASGTTTQYTVPIVVGTSKTLKWIARDTLGNTSAVQSAAYTITSGGGGGGALSPGTVQANFK